MAFDLPDLPYAYDALDPVINKETMELHHDKHHAAYTAKLNDALAGTEWAEKSIEEVLTHLDQLPAEKQAAVRNNGGGYFNHSLFWETMTAPGTGGEPTGDLAAAIESDLGGMEAFKSAFADAGATQFGSGWAWLCVEPSGKLHVTKTANQDTTFMPAAFGGHGDGHHPILGLDVWEHAYYLMYRNRRPDYIKAFFEVINWSVVGEKYAAAKA
ncbi:MAG: superoxide dismutase [Planctomycetota bacterium]